MNCCCFSLFYILLNGKSWSLMRKQDIQLIMKLNNWLPFILPSQTLFLLFVDGQYGRWFLFSRLYPLVRSSLKIADIYPHFLSFENAINPVKCHFWSMNIGHVVIMNWKFYWDSKKKNYTWQQEVPEYFPLTDTVQELYSWPQVNKVC